jgi:hypothetical protein
VRYEINIMQDREVIKSGWLTTHDDRLTQWGGRLPAPRGVDITPIDITREVLPHPVHQGHVIRCSLASRT